MNVDVSGVSGSNRRPKKIVTKVMLIAAFQTAQGHAFRKLFYAGGAVTQCLLYSAASMR